jgi:hypothetical protein
MMADAVYSTKVLPETVSWLFMAPPSWYLGLSFGRVGAALSRAANGGRS